MGCLLGLRRTAHGNSLATSLALAGFVVDENLPAPPPVRGRPLVRAGAPRALYPVLIDPLPQADLAVAPRPAVVVDLASDGADRWPSRRVRLRLWPACRDPCRPLGRLRWRWKRRLRGFGHQLSPFKSRCSIRSAVSQPATAPFTYGEPCHDANNSAPNTASTTITLPTSRPAAVRRSP